MSDFLFRDTLEDLDPSIHNVNRLEAARQFHKIILIASESTAPIAAVSYTHLTLPPSDLV